MPSTFTEVAVIRHDSGLVAVITERDRGDDYPPAYSFAIMKEFERNGRTERTAFISRRHLVGARTLLDQAESRLDDLEDRARARRRT